MEENKNIEDLFADSKEYLETRIELAKLQAVEKSSEIAGSAVTGLLLLLFFTMVFLFGSVALAFYLSEKTGHYSTGFLTVAGIYLTIGLIVYLARESWIKKPISNAIIHKMLKEDE
ncbi:MAG: phage holin family protein [Bacteroidetes bacterium]|jgi:hypothetical protein|nr:phage holin family protein [Bacteroidota bacterium]MBK9413517.1 phage holin family protein [Bacteroidota bacterium]MBL0032680.1 phage holin family protein [Bacteroidota bacterium]MBP6426145.1 phage holin family protein [Bacteroidia bacterium]MBP6656600.1 phage holin family protein [Bacteroidia bacterium]